MKKTITTVVMGLTLFGPVFGHDKVKVTEEAKVEAPAEGQAKVQIAILLDTSGSMSGLIDQAKTQLWKVVNTFITAKQNGKVPFVEVALYEYGKSSLRGEDNWIRQIQPLTRDLDKVSEELFALTTNGGEEYCGAVIQKATSELKWDSSGDVYKAIFIAGNEAFTQGPIQPDKSCKEAIAKGVIVNTIHCGREVEGVNGGWKDGAVLADGRFLTIDHNQAVVHIEAPQDEEIVKLNTELNDTYIGFGRTGRARKEMQLANDAKAFKEKTSGAAVQRAVAKGSSNYYNSGWDIVDASKQKNFDWTKLKDEELPEEMRKLDLEGRKKFVADKEKKRGEIQKKIQTLNSARNKFVAKKRAEMAKTDEKNTLDQVMSETVREQAKKKGYQFSE